MPDAKPIEVHIFPALLEPGETVRDGSQGEPLELRESTLLLWVDLDPKSRFAHPTCTVLIGASGAKVIKGSWWAIVDDKLRFPPTTGSAPDVVFPSSLDKARLHLLPGEIRPEDELTDGAGGKPLPIQGNSIVLWLDLEPDAKYHHPTQYIIIGPQGVEVVNGVERPTLRGKHRPIGVRLASPSRRTLMAEWNRELGGDPTRVLDVTLADLARVKADRERLTLTAVGRVPSLGWSNARLVPHVYIQKPPDGIWGYDFVAQPPSGPAGDAIGIVSASVGLMDSKDLSGVCIHAAQGQYILRVPQIAEGAPPDGDHFSVESCAFEGDQLVFQVRYGGGCRPHHFRLLWSGALMKSNPPQASFQLVHDANQDPCKALLHDTLRFDLLDLPPVVMHLSTAFDWKQTLRHRLPSVE
jgi:hypothetical protein